MPSRSAARCSWPAAGLPRSASPGDGQHGWAVVERVAGPGHLLGVARRYEPGEPAGHGGEHRGKLDTGERGTEAVVRPVPEPEVRVGRPRWVETGGGGEPQRG